MVKPLYIEPTDETPRVTFDPEQSIFELVGNSYPENATKFYTPVLNWIKEFTKDVDAQNVTIDFNFDYFNTSSAKYILEILRSIQELQSSGRECLVRWYYFEDDTDMQEAGEDYQNSIDVPFELIMREDTI